MNNFAISSDGIATALQDSASALMAGGNSMEEATAMIAAANKVVQDPSKVGAGLRTISLRLRGTEVSKELEELGEDTDGLVSSSKMRDKIMGLAGVDILTDTGAYKSTYDIIKEIAYVWEDMSDMDQAALLELMAGKNRSNIMAALLTNVEDLEGAYEKAMDAEGSAYRENEAYLDSIQGRVDLFMNALQTFWMNFISSDMIKGIVDLGTTLIQFLDTAYGKATALGVAFTAFLKITKNVDNFKNAVRSIFSVNSNTSDVAANTAVTQANTEAKMANVSATNAETEANTAEAASSTVASEADAAETVSSSTASAADTAEAAASSQASAADTVEAVASQAAAEADMAESVASSAASVADATESATSGIASTTTAVSGLSKVSNVATTAFGKLKNVVVAHPFMAIAAAVLVAVAAIDKFTISAKEASEASHDKFNEISDVYSTTKSNISDMEGELSTINSQIAELEGKNLSFTDAQELERLKAQRSELENNLSIQEQLLEAQEKVKNEAAVAAMKDFVKASNEGAESAEKTGKAIGAIAGGLLAVGGIAAAAFTGGTSLVATVEGLGLMTTAGIIGGGAVVGATAGGVTASNVNAATVNSYEDWYKTYTEAYKKKSQAAADARKKYEKDPGDMDKYDEWQELEQEAMDVQSKMYDNLTQMQNYYSDIEYGQSEALDRELDTWYNFLDKMNIDQNGAVAKVNALDRIFGENASDEIKEFKKEIDKVIKNSDDEFDIAAEIEGRDELQGLEDQLDEIGITTDEVSDYFRQTGEIGTTAFSDLSGEIKEAKDAVTKLQAALDNNTNQGYETRNTAIEEMKHLMEEGIIGSESNLWNIAEAMGFTYDSAKSIEENADALYDYIEARDAWYEVDEDGEWGTAGADAFAKDIENAVKNSKKLQDMEVKWDFNEETGELNFDFNNMKFDEIVTALGETKEAAGLTNEEFIDMLTHLGQFYDVQWTSGNDVASYLEYLSTTGLSAKEQLDAVQSPLDQLLRNQGLDSDEIEDYLTGNGSLKELPEDLQKAVGAYRNLHNEMEKETGNGGKASGRDSKDPRVSINIDRVKEELADIDKLVDEDRQVVIDAVTKYKNGGSIDDLITDINSIEDKEVRKKVIMELEEEGALDELFTNLNWLDKKVVIKAITEGKGDVDELNRIIDLLPPEVQSTVRALVDDSMQDLEIVDEKLQKVDNTEATPDVSVRGADKAAKDADNVTDSVNNIPTSKNVKISAPGATGAKKDVDDLDDSVDNLSSTKTVTIWAQIRKKASDLWDKITGGGVGVNGTAHFGGTAHAKGTAYAGGNWGAPRTETALTGELGPELLVRNGRWTTIGENGAEFTEIKKGDIIFNHKQTEELLKNGYVTSGGGRGKAYAEGTAYAGGGGKRRVYTFTDDSVKKKNKNSNSSKNNSKSKKNSKDTTEEFEEVFDWFEVKIEEINEDLDLMAAKLENAITIKGKNNILDDMIKTNKSELTTLEKGYKLYNNYANDLIKEIPKKYREEAKNGKIAIEEFYGEVDEGTLEAIKNYREWAQKAADLKVQIQETKREIAELAKQKFDNISEKYDNIEGLQDNRQQHYVDMAELREDKGKINSGKYYKAAMKEEEKQKKSKQNEKKKLQASLDNAVKKGQIKKYSQEWYDMVNDIHAVDAEIDECTANIENYQNEINNIHFDNFEKKMSRTQYVADDLQDLIDLVDNLDESFDESGNWTDEGITKMGLYAQSMEVAQVQSQEYAEEIAYLKKNWKSMGMSYDEYQEKLAELNGKQQDAIDVYHDSKDAILEMQKARVDAIKNGIDEEIEAYEELIDKKKEELDAEKDLHDFQKNVMDQQKDIADIQRKLAALAGDNSAAAMAKRRQLEAELAESKQGLEDTYYDRSIENKQTALDKQLEAFTKAKEEEKEMWDEWLKNPEVVLKDGIDTVEGSGDTVKTVLGQTMDEFGISIRDSIMKPWNDSGTALDTTASKVQAIVTAFENAATAADTYAQKQINNQKEDNQDITAQGQRGKNNSGNPLKGVKVTAEKGTQLYDKNGNKIKETTGKGKNKKTVDKKVKKDTEYTAGKTNSKGMTALLNSKGQVVGYAKASDLDEKFKKGMTINADGAQLYDSADDKKGEAQNLETYTVLAVDNKVKRVKAKSTKKNSQGKYVTGWFDMSQVTITKLAKKKEQNSNGNTGKNNTGKNNTGKNNTGKNNTGNNKNNNTKKAPKKGDSVTVDKSAKNYGSKSNNLKIPDFVKGGTYTVMQTSGSGDKMQVLIGKKGTPTGWVKLKDLKGYAKGSKSINKDQLALLDELGEELQIVPNSQGRLDYVKKGTGIIPADMTERLMNLAMNPQDMLDRNRPTIGVSPEIHNTEINLNMQYGDMLRIENFNGDSPEDVAKIVAKQFEKHTAQLNQSLRKYVR